jgi:heme-degrading monooxygenase HmoA
MPPELRRFSGFLGACLSARRLADRVEFLVLTRWQSLDVDRAVVDPAAAATLLENDRAAHDYNTIEEG